MYIDFALSIFFKEAFGKTTNHIILFVLDLAYQSNIKNFVGNIRRICEIFYYIFMTRYISRLKIY